MLPAPAEAGWAAGSPGPISSQMHLVPVWSPSPFSGLCSRTVSAQAGWIQNRGHLERTPPPHPEGQEAGDGGEQTVWLRAFANRRYRRVPSGALASSPSTEDQSAQHLILGQLKCPDGGANTRHGNKCGTEMLQGPRQVEARCVCFMSKPVGRSGQLDISSTNAPPFPHVVRNESRLPASSWPKRRLSFEPSCRF